MPSKTLQPRRGTLYLSVLGTALVVSITALSAMHVARGHLRAANGVSDTSAARAAAEAGVAYGLAETVNNSSWRTDHTTQVAAPAGDWLPVGVSGEFQYSYDAGGLSGGGARALDASDADVVTLRGVGQAGDALSVAEVTLINDGAAYSCLSLPVSTQNNLVLVGHSNLYGADLIVHAGGNIEKNGGSPTIYGIAEAVGAIQNNITDGGASDEHEGVAARQFPNPNAVFEYYKQRGTWIDVASLPTELGNPIIKNQTLSSAANPFSSETNPEGIYVIDCQGRRVIIENSLITGTLLLLNNASNSEVTGSVSWQAAVSNYPALLVENGLELTYGSGSITGLIYIAGAAIVDNSGGAVINGVLVCQSMQISGDLTVNYSSTFSTTPPPGFAGQTDLSGQSPMQVIPGSWRRAAQ